MANGNPFTPTFGSVPPHLAGRAEILEQMSNAFEGPIGNPNLSTILIGSCGSGKTALLSCIADEATKKGWVCVTVVASSGMLEDIIQRTLATAAGIINSKSRKRLTGIEIAQFLGIEWTLEQQEQENWRTRMTAILDALAEHGAGLLICVDEVNVREEELIQLAANYQLFIGEGRRISVVMAGLPKHTIDLIDNERVSFLRRARQRQLGLISNAEIERAFRASVEDAHKKIETEALKLAVNAIGGYAYMMQLVGYCTWESSRDKKTISLDHVQQGISQAVDEFKVGVLDSTYREMSKGDRAFVNAMLADKNGSTLTSVAQRMGRGTNYASTYKTRLLQRGVFVEYAGGSFNFAIPFLRDYLKQMQNI